MPRRASRNHQDVAGGLILGSRAPTVFINGTRVSVIGDPVRGHGPGLHASPVMATGSNNVFAHNIPCCRDADIANCGHPTVANSPNVFIN